MTPAKGTLEVFYVPEVTCKDFGVVAGGWYAMDGHGVRADFGPYLNLEALEHAILKAGYSLPPDHFESPANSN